MNSPTLPPSPPRFVKSPRRWFSTSGLMIYLLPLALVIATLKAFSNANLGGIIVNAGGYALYALAANLLRKGLQAEAEYTAKRVIRAPKWPLKTIAAGLVAMATFVIALLGAQHGLWVAIAFGGGALLGMYLNYGFDPRAEKTVLGSHGYSTAEIRQTIDDAEAAIVTIEAANKQIRNQEFNQRIKRICVTARGILAELELNPAAIRRTRKFLLIYLDGARKVTSGYASTHQQAALTQELEQNFREVLDSIESVFKEQREKLLQEDVFDLDVQIEVLATQLKNEGLV